MLACRSISVRWRSSRRLAQLESVGSQRLGGDVLALFSGAIKHPWFYFLQWLPAAAHGGNPLTPGLVRFVLLTALITLSVVEWGTNWSLPIWLCGLPPARSGRRSPSLPGGSAAPRTESGSGVVAALVPSAGRRGRARSRTARPPSLPDTRPARRSGSTGGGVQFDAERVDHFQNGIESRSAIAR